MNRSEEAAMKAYPDNDVLFFAKDAEGNDHPVTIFGREVNGFIFGYEQAEKDLALTINDLELLHTFLYAIKNNKQGCFTFTRLSNEQYEEVLRRFNEAKMK